MSEAQRITTTSAAGRRALGSAGQRSFELISRTVARRLSPAHAAIFAEPVMPEQSNQTDWYTSLSGRARPLSSLDDAQKLAVEARLAGLLQDIRAVAAGLLAAKDAETQRLGEALENVLSIPGEDAVWVIESNDPDTPPQPVIVDWATLPDSRSEMTERELTGWAPRAGPVIVSPVIVPVQPVEPRRTVGFMTWLVGGLWLLLGVLTGIVLYLLIPPCGLSGLSRLNYCPAPLAVDEVAQTEVARQRSVLENRIAFFEREFALTEDACVAIPPPPPPPPPPPEPEPEPEPELVPEPPPEVVQREERPAPPADEIQERLEREDATVGEAMIALVWDNRSDLDLHVTCPARDRIYFERPSSSACHGRLDVDMNADGSRMSNEPIEHIYFTEPLPGRYRIEVVLYNPGNYPGPHNFQVRVSFGNDTRQFSGTVSRGSPRWSTTYDYAP